MCALGMVLFWRRPHVSILIDATTIYVRPYMSKNVAAFIVEIATLFYSVQKKLSSSALIYVCRKLFYLNDQVNFDATLDQRHTIRCCVRYRLIDMRLWQVAMFSFLQSMFSWMNDGSWWTCWAIFKVSIDVTKYLQWQLRKQIVKQLPLNWRSMNIRFCPGYGSRVMRFLDMETVDTCVYAALCSYEKWRALPQENCLD